MSPPLIGGEIAGTQTMKMMTPDKLKLSDLLAEPFRLFFPTAVLTGLLGVAVWPLYFGGFFEMYPGAGHTRLMGQGFFGGFILGFLGTAFPRMLSVQPFRSWQLAGCLALFLIFVGAHFTGNTYWGDAAFLSLLVVFLGSALAKVPTRRDVPPPGFVLAGLAFICGMAGTVISLLEQHLELDPRWSILRPLLAYQGFVLLPVLGVGAFILPKFLGLPNTHDLPVSTRPPAGWWIKALFALSVGLLIVGSFIIEVYGWYRSAYTLRFAAVAIYLLRTVPAHQMKTKGNAINGSLRIGLIMILLGLLSVVVWPGYRVALLHVLLVGGLGVVTMIVATRVVLGHSGNASMLSARNRWFWWATGLILLGMATRISGDFLPHIMISHYNYGVLCWAIGIGLWAWKVLPKVLIPDRS
jgi:uncharacterized protein involved in response to NO